MKILAQFGIFIRIIILNIGGKKANTQIDYQPTLLASFFSPPNKIKLFA